MSKMLGHLVPYKHKGGDGSAQEESKSSEVPPRALGLLICQDPPRAILDIVFVHGLTGTRDDTWTSKKTGTFWPKDLLLEDIPDARIMTFGYDANIVHFWSMASQNRIANHAQNLLNRVTQVRERSDTEDRPIIFVAHSLGGLVVEDVLLASKNSAEPHLQKLIECTVGIAFLGTPHCGSDLAGWANIFSGFLDVFKTSNTELLSVLKPESEVLARIQQEFHAMLRSRVTDGKRKLNITCFYEELPVRGVNKIVPDHSSILPGYSSSGIHANHMDMPKFSSSEDPGYQSVSSELWRWAKTVRTEAKATGPPDNQVAAATTSSPAVQDAWAPRQGGNLIENQQQLGYGNTMQGNNVSSGGDTVLNFGR